MSSGPACFVWSSPEGRYLARSILKNTLPYDPHDYQLEGVCKLLDGFDLLAVIATGCGKTGYFTMYMLVQLALASNPGLCEPPWTRTPKDPGMILVYPTVGLEEEMAVIFEKLGLKPLVINGRTLQEARRSRRDLWEEAKRGHTMVLLSPELLTSKGFERLMQSTAFQDRICALGIDEVHLLNSWGAGFRKSFQQLGYIRARMLGDILLVGTSASILSGAPRTNICNFLGLQAGQYHFLQRSNVRPDLQLVFRSLSHGLGGWSFPDFRWVLGGRRKTVFFCSTIALSFRLFCYLRTHCAPADHPDLRIRMYNSLNWPSYNEETRALMRTDERAQIVIATASFMVGVDLPNICDVILTQQPADADEWIQWGGRAGRDSRVVRDARVITYLTKKAPETAHAVIKAASAGTLSSHGGTSKKATKAAVMDISIAKVIVAPCKVTAQNELYGNPPTDPPCTCRSCSDPLLRPPSSSGLPCNCSGCQPEDALTAMDAPSKKQDSNPVPQSKRISREMRNRGRERLLELRQEIYNTLDSSPQSCYLPPSVYLPDAVITAILDRLLLIDNTDDLRRALAGRTYALKHVEKIWPVVIELQAEVEVLRAKAREEKRVKAAAKRAALKAGAVRVQEDTGIEDEGGVTVEGGDRDEAHEPQRNDGTTSACATIRTVPDECTAPQVASPGLAASGSLSQTSYQTFLQPAKFGSGSGYAMHLLSFGDASPTKPPSKGTATRKRQRKLPDVPQETSPKRRRITSNKENTGM